MTFEQVVTGVIKYIERELFSGLEPWQRVFAGVFVTRVSRNAERLKKLLVEDKFLSLAQFVDEEGLVDVDAVASDLKAQIGKVGSVKIKLPIVDTYTFTVEDVDVLLKTIKGG